MGMNGPNTVPVLRAARYLGVAVGVVTLFLAWGLHPVLRVVAPTWMAKHSTARYDRDIWGRRPKGMDEHLRAPIWRISLGPNGVYEQGGGDDVVLTYDEQDDYINVSMPWDLRFREPLEHTGATALIVAWATLALPSFFASRRRAPRVEIGVAALATTVPAAFAAWFVYVERHLIFSRGFKWDCWLAAAFPHSPISPTLGVILALLAVCFGAAVAYRVRGEEDRVRLLPR
jgi:hypothetical protein